jgi:hypothetical protein
VRAAHKRDILVEAIRACSPYELFADNIDSAKSSHSRGDATSPPRPVNGCDANMRNPAAPHLPQHKMGSRLVRDEIPFDVRKKIWNADEARIETFGGHALKLLAAEMSAEGWQ